MLLGREAGERLKPMGIMGGAVLDGPVLHRRRHHVGYSGVERLTPINGSEEALVHLFREPLPHHAAGEDVTAENAINPFGVAHTTVQGTRRGGHGYSRLVGSGGEK
jgi:hypothetical protein